jgi:hypothetical protein
MARMAEYQGLWRKVVVEKLRIDVDNGEELKNGDGHLRPSAD